MCEWVGAKFVKGAQEVWEVQTRGQCMEVTEREERGEGEVTEGE